MRITLLNVYLFTASFSFVFFPAQSYYTTKQIDSLMTSNENPKDWDLKKNINFLNIIYKESEKIHYEKGMYRALFRITSWYMQKGQYKNAFPYFEKIENLPLEVPENYKYKVAAQNSKATAFIGLGLFEDAQVAIEEAMRIIKVHSGREIDHELQGKVYDTQANLYIQMKKPEDSVRFYLKKSAFQYRQVKNEQYRGKLLGAAYINISTSFFETKKLDSAMFYSYKALKIKDLALEAKAYVFQTIGQIHRENNDLDSAFYYYKNAETRSARLGDPMALKGIYQALSEMYHQSGDKDHALLYAKKYSHLSDSLGDVNKESARIANKYIKEELAEENEFRQKRLYWVVGIIFIVLCLISWYLLKKYRTEKNARQNEQIIIENKEWELKELKSRVNESFDEIVHLAKNNDTALLCRFKEVYPDFCEKLQQICPDILNSELTFCAYLKLNFSTKEIATYTYTAAKSVQNRKNRLRKRLNIPSNEDIYIWIGNI